MSLFRLKSSRRSFRRITMAKPPPGLGPVDPAHVKLVEDWLDSNIPDDAEQFMILCSTVKTAFPTMTEKVWDEIVNRYQSAGWTIVSRDHWVSKENGGGPYFYLSKY